MIFNTTKIKLISVLSYIFPFGFINALLFQDFENDYVKFNVIQGFIVNLLYLCFIIFYLMIALLIGPIPYVGYIKNIVGFVFLSISLFITIRVFFAILDEEIYKVPFLGFFVENFEK
ncbi:MAG: hypothetical protein ACO2O6_01745 [Candidatus Hydrothermia bacterium]|jgi:uncharacterized membrane protein|nr:hypothetical protein [Candidatus Hydrothermia bacterium]